MSANDRREVVTLLTHTRYNVQNFVYVRRRPFHPRRLFEFLHDKFILQHPEVEEDDEMDEDDDDDDEDNKSDTNMEDADNTNAEGATDSDGEEDRSSSPSRAENSSTRDSVSSASSPPLTVPRTIRWSRPAERTTPIRAMSTPTARSATDGLEARGGAAPGLQSVSGTRPGPAPLSSRPTRAAVPGSTVRSPPGQGLFTRCRYLCLSDRRPRVPIPEDP